eukprot:94002-Pleurochrysis_carterae.AAC.1
MSSLQESARAVAPVSLAPARTVESCFFFAWLGLAPLLSFFSVCASFICALAAPAAAARPAAAATAATGLTPCERDAAARSSIDSLLCGGGAPESWWQK